MKAEEAKQLALQVIALRQKEELKQAEEGFKECVEKVADIIQAEALKGKLFVRINSKTIGEPYESRGEMLKKHFTEQGYHCYSDSLDAVIRWDK